MNIKNEIDNLRKDKLGLNNYDTKLIFNTIIDVYKSKIINENRNTIGYTIDLVIANMNGFNRLGDAEKINQKWGDIFYIDLNNSVFCKEVINEGGDIICNDNCINLNNITELEKLNNISFSLKDLILLCNENNINIKLFTKDDYSTMTTLEMKLYENFDPNEDSINKYLSTVVVDK